ncbi:MAG: hypothetical protein ACHP7P_13235 [Terriglobales bacterium]
MLVDSTAHEFPLRNARNPRQLLVIRNGVPFAPVLDGFEFQQTQIFAFFPVPVGFLPDVDGWPVRNDVRPLQQSSRIKLARLPVRPEALGFRMVLVRLAIAARCIDFIVGEVKGGSDNVNFNVRFRDDPEAIRTVLQHFGAFPDGEIDRVCSRATHFGAADAPPIRFLSGAGCSTLRCSQHAERQAAVRSLRGRTTPSNWACSALRV